MSNERERHVPLKPGAYAANESDLAKTFWLLQRHTSVTFIQRMVDMLIPFTEGFELYVAKLDDPGRSLNHLIGLKGDCRKLETGIARLKKGDTGGFRDIMSAQSFFTPFISRAYDECWFDLGLPEDYHDLSKPQGLWSWMYRIEPMAKDISGTIEGVFWYPGLKPSDYLIPEQIGGFPFFDLGTPIATGQSVPVSGVYMPSMKGGCPNYLVQGFKAPEIRIPKVRIDRLEYTEKPEPDDPPNYVNKHFPYEEGYDFDTVTYPTTWHLRWEDDRWRDKREPLGEEDYLLDPMTDFPTEPNRAIRDPENPPPLKR